MKIKKGIHIDEPTEQMIIEMRRVQIYNLSANVRRMIKADYEQFLKEQKRNNENRAKNKN